MEKIPRTSITHMFWFFSLLAEYCCSQAPYCLSPTGLKVVYQVFYMPSVAGDRAYSIWRQWYALPWWGTLHTATGLSIEMGISGHDDILIWNHFSCYSPMQSAMDSLHKGPVIWSFTFVFPTSLNNVLDKQSRRRWFETIWCSCEVTVWYIAAYPKKSVNVSNFVFYFRSVLSDFHNLLCNSS